MNRREFLKTSSTTVAGLGVSKVVANAEPAGAAEPARRSRPNILYIMTDQQFAGAMSCAGNPHLRTPAMDSLAADGVRFDRAYCAQPLCVPSRTVMMTGRMPHETGVTYNIRAHPIRVPMMGAVFSRGGYDCGYFGKWHLTVPQTATALHGFSTVGCRVSAARGKKKDPDVPPACSEFIKRERDKPFLMVASFLNPHDICQWARGDDLPNGPIGKSPPPNQCPPLPDNFEIPDREPEILRAIQKRGPKIYPTVGWAPDRWRQYRWAYYRLMEKVDAQIGLLLDALRRSGRMDDTVIVFASDHGDGHGAHRWNQKQVLYEEPARVPFIVSGCGVTKAGHVDRRHLVSTGLDLMPTLCDYAGIAPPSGLRGLSVRPLAEGRDPGRWRSAVVTETTLGGAGGSYNVGGRMLRTDRYKYIVYSAGKIREQLFDMERDPGETMNLVGQADHQATLNDHRERLRAWCKETDDAFSVPASC